MILRFADLLIRFFAFSLIRLFADLLTADSLISIFEGDAMCWRTPSKDENDWWQASRFEYT